MTTGAIRWPAIRCAAVIPSSLGIFTSSTTRSGRCSSARSTAVWPSPAWPTTSYPSSASISARSRRISASSSAMTTRRAGAPSTVLTAARLYAATVGYSGSRSPRYPNRQRKRSQTPSSVGSSPTRGTSGQLVRRSASAHPSVGGRDLVGGVPHPVDPQRVRGAGNPRRGAGDDHHQVALDDPADLQQRLVDLAHHLVGVLDRLAEEGLDPPGQRELRPHHRHGGEREHGDA